MWKNTYKDYKPDHEWVQEKVEPGMGIVGCEMHEKNGWGEMHHHSHPKKKGILTFFISLIFKTKG